MYEKKRTAQSWIISGFALVALGAMDDFGVLVSNNYFGEGNFRADLQLFAIPISSVAALWAWWFLGKIVASQSAHAPFFKKAFLGLSLQFACLSLVYVNLLWSRPGLDKYTTSTWLQALGMVSSAIGFFLMARGFSSKQNRIEEAAL
jgi:hypothetical protein